MVQKFLEDEQQLCLSDMRQSYQHIMGSCCIGIYFWSYRKYNSTCTTLDKSERPSMEIVLQTFHRTSSNRPSRSISGLSICNKEICITFYVVFSQTFMSVRFVYFRGRSYIQCHVNLCNVDRQIFESDSSSLVPVQTRRQKVHTSVGWDMDSGQSDFNVTSRWCRGQ